VPAPERRPALGPRKRPRAHPISPEAANQATAPERRAAPRVADAPVMLCVRVPASLRRRLKLLSVQTGRPVQQLATAALEAECRRYGA
jgi:hypothetical protein